MSSKTPGLGETRGGVGNKDTSGENWTAGESPKEGGPGKGTMPGTVIYKAPLQKGRHQHEVSESAGRIKCIDLGNAGQLCPSRLSSKSGKSKKHGKKKKLKNPEAYFGSNDPCPATPREKKKKKKKKKRNSLSQWKK